MEWYQIISFVFSILSVPTIVGMLWKDLHDRAKANSEQAKQRHREENKNVIREVVQEENREMAASVANVISQLGKVCESSKCSLRNAILTNYYSCVLKGYRNDYDYQNMHELYDAYDDLHGNSFVHDVMERLDALPTKEEYRTTHNEHKHEGGERADD